MRKIWKKIVLQDVDILEEKGRQYGDSWKKRGGVGAFMMLARKWDRIEKAVEKSNYDIFHAIDCDPELTDDLMDLQNYLLLVRSEGYVDDDLSNSILNIGANEEGAEPESRGYVSQDSNDWSELARRDAKEKHEKKLLNKGDTELLDYFEVAYRPDTTNVQRDNLITDLRWYYTSLQAKGTFPQPLSSLIAKHQCVESYRNPRSGNLIRMPDSSVYNPQPQRYEKDQP